MKRCFRACAAALAAALLGAGCVTGRLIEDTRVPELAIDASGRISLNGKAVERGRLVEAMRDAGFTRRQEINILIPENPDKALMASVTGELVRGGFSRTIFVKKRQAFSKSAGGPGGVWIPGPAAPAGGAR